MYRPQLTIKANGLPVVSNDELDVIGERLIADFCPIATLVPVKASRNKNCDYFRVSLSKNNIIRQFPVHRIVAENFVPRKPGCDFVNHIDGNKHNNAAENLEWVTASGNKMHAVYTGIDIPNFGIKRVYCLTNGKVYPSASQAARELGLDDSSVSKVCRGKRGHTKGMVFRYV